MDIQQSNHIICTFAPARFHPLHNASYTKRTPYSRPRKGCTRTTEQRTVLIQTFRLRRTKCKRRRTKNSMAWKSQDHGEICGRLSRIKRDESERRGTAQKKNGRGGRKLHHGVDPPGVNVPHSRPQHFQEKHLPRAVLSARHQTTFDDYSAGCFAQSVPHAARRLHTTPLRLCPLFRT